MKKNALVIFAHPDVENESIGNKVILNELNKEADIEVRELYKLYPDFNIDVAAEQDALRKADIIVLQFPFFWYSCPALLKKWMDDVFLYGFAFGSTGKELNGKELILSVTIGGAADSYTSDGYNSYPVDEFMTPFKQTANLTGMLFNEEYHYSHGMINIPGIDYPKETTIAIAHKHVDKLIAELKAKMSGEAIEKEMAVIMEVITGIRNIRGEMNLNPGLKLNVLVKTQNSAIQQILQDHGEYIRELARVEQLETGPNIKKPKVSASSVLGEMDLIIPLEGKMDFQEELKRVEKELKKIEKDLIFLDKKLSNPDFVKKAPVDIIEKDEQRKKSLSLKQAKLEIHLKTIEQGLC